MCFSAGASFGAGVVLSAVGVATLRKAQSPSQIPLAGVPLIFGMQQIAEGLVWVSLTYSAYAHLQTIGAYFFLIVAQVIWPSLVPFAIFEIDRSVHQKWRRRMEIALMVIGLAVSAFLGYHIYSYPLDATIQGHHILYRQDYLHQVNKGFALFYVLVTIVPPFLSRVKGMFPLGICVLVSYIISVIFYTQYIVSVWCFFAAIISVSIYVMLHRMHYSKHGPAHGSGTAHA